LSYGLACLGEPQDGLDLDSNLPEEYVESVIWWGVLSVAKAGGLIKMVEIEPILDCTYREFQT